MNRALDTLFAWCAERGIVLDARLHTIQVTPTCDYNGKLGELTLVATKPVGVGELLAIIPSAALLSVHTSALGQVDVFRELSKKNTNPHLLLALCILHERLLGASSSYHGYIASLPWDMDLPFMWNDAHEEYEWFKETEAWRILRRNEWTWHANVPRRGICLVCSCDALTKQGELQQFWRNNGSSVHGPDATHDAFFHAFTLVSSRAFVIDTYHGFVSCANHTDADSAWSQSQTYLIMQHLTTFKSSPIWTYVKHVVLPRIYTAKMHRTILIQLFT